MGTVEITLTLPEEVAEQARKADLLSPEQMASLIIAELERRARARAAFRETLEKLRSDPPPFTQEEIDAEIAAARAERMAQRTE